MTIKNTFADVKLDVSVGTQPSAVVSEPETSFRILLIGDFSGHAAEVSQPSIRWAPVRIDRDNFDEVMARLDVACPELSMSFRDLDDFHPDAIYEQHSGLFEPVPDREAPTGPEVQTAPQAPTAPPAAAPAGSLLEAMLDAAEPEPPRPAKRPDSRDQLQAFVDKVTAPYTEPAEDPARLRRRELELADYGTRMRAILHNTAFQAREAAWRGVFRLVREIETGRHLKLYLLDLSRAELEADLASSEDLKDTRAWRLLVEETVGTPGADPWAVVAGNYTFTRTSGDAQMLSRLAKIMSFGGAPFLGEIDPGDSRKDTEEAGRKWEALRQTPEASWIGLAMPRFLLRLPYGRETDQVESLDFEEMPGTPEHQHYLWGNPAFACVQLLAEAFTEYGWEMRPGVCSEIGGLPLHVYRADGETQVQPCAEVLLTERDTDWILDEGYMPLVSIKDRDAVRLLRFQSIAQPPAALSGRWDT